MECYSPAAHAPYHLNWPVIDQNLPRIAAKRVMLTHMSDAMLKSAAALESRRDIILAEDGLVIRI
jgi:hypothetical protein